jgi:hypothetical protein
MGDRLWTVRTNQLRPGTRRRRVAQLTLGRRTPEMTFSDATMFVE